ncbi:hypothetical protein MVEN_02501200 [Mycena venus]|uniref:Uncharacterized protein n=1 Tax=Mycena venus TaxID=2733690 RepID=A0A8H6WT06_9AGAR|nr:hypothetical protein MVEN_02501200 [Mycena venus]
MDFKPGVFNVPSNPDGNEFTRLSCASREEELTGVMARVSFAQITKTGVTFFDSAKEAIFSKGFAYLDVAFWALADDKSMVSRSIFFRSSPRIWDDIGFSAILDTEAGPIKLVMCNPVNSSNLTTDAEAFLAELREASPPHSRKYIFPTKTYILDGRHAKLLPPENTLSTIITDTLTALACTDVAEVLGPVWDWSVAHTPIQISKIVAEVQKWLRTSLPPLVVVADSAEGSNLFPEFTFRDDLEGRLDTVHARSLPQRPVWPLEQVNLSPSEMWVLPAISNYGVPRRKREANAVPVIMISTELVGWLLAAIDETGHNSQADAAIRSLRAATASIKMTFVHELAHVWVTQKHQGDSPLRRDVVGANVPKYDAAEDERSVGVIEAGNLVETAWLGGPHKLALDNNGWLQFVVCEAKTSASPSTSMTSNSSSDTSSENIQGGSFLNRLVRSSDSNSGDMESDFSTDSEEHEAVSTSPSSSPSSSSPLGSPIQLQRTYGNHVLFHDPEIAAVEGQDRIQYVRVCNDEVLKSLWAPGLPRLSGCIGDLSPLIRAKGFRHLHTPSPSPQPASPPTQRQRPDNLFVGKVVPLYPITDDLPPRWPSVFGRNVPHEAEDPGEGDQRSNADRLQRCTTPKTPGTMDK